MAGMLRRTACVLGSPRRIRMTVKHWDMLHELLAQDESLGLSPERVEEAPWPALPPTDLSSFELEWRRFRNVSQLVANGTILPPRWYRMARAIPPTSGPFWGDPPVHAKEHQYPLRRHWWTKNLKPPTELMKVFLLRKEDKVYDENYRRVIGFSPKDKVRQELKVEVTDAAKAGRATFSFFWQRKPLERMEARYWQLKKDGVSDAEAKKVVSNEYFQTVARQRIIQGFYADGARTTGKAISAYQAQVVMELLQVAQQSHMSNAQADELRMQIREGVQDAAATTAEGARGTDDADEEVKRYLEYSGLQPSGPLVRGAPPPRPRSPILPPFEAAALARDGQPSEPTLEERIGQVPNRGREGRP
eukprot:TRINITY_DN10451_c0_g1_i1.p1 TRINITY_DN10451_c0_g1~~TRINITY_DN10451_c0_g1_i1.p1  ORF type:complete len:361 (+),score=102.62 TRINITY_DN10451_c0_g1_i1:237-1319(+)